MALENLHCQQQSSYHSYKARHASSNCRAVDYKYASDPLNIDPEFWLASYFCRAWQEAAVIERELLFNIACLTEAAQSSLPIFRCINCGTVNFDAST
jgi:hypothetical protein